MSALKFETGKRVIIIDDDPGVREAYQKVFDNTDSNKISKLGGSLFGTQKKEIPAKIEFELTLVDRGEKGVQAVKKGLESNRPFAVAFVDMRMPGINGAETARKLWAVDPSIQIVIVTAYSDYNPDEITKITGREDLFYLQKPFNADEIYQFARCLCKLWEVGQERDLLQQQTQFLALHDSLTGLPNRALLQDRLDQAIAGAKRSGRMLALMFLDLDHFKEINDTCGHDAGDLLLQLVTERLKSCVREKDTIARIGGDEFVILLTDFKQRSDVIKVADKLLGVISTVFLLQKEEFSVSASIGVSLFPDDAESRQDLIKKADLAMYFAKQKGRNNAKFFTSKMKFSSKKIRDRH